MVPFQDPRVQVLLKCLYKMMHTVLKEYNTPERVCKLPAPCCPSQPSASARACSMPRCSCHPSWADFGMSDTPWKDLVLLHGEHSRSRRRCLEGERNEDRYLGGQQLRDGG